MVSFYIVGFRGFWIYEEGEILVLDLRGFCVDKEKVGEEVGFRVVVFVCSLLLVVGGCFSSFVVFFFFNWNCLYVVTNSKFV